MKPKLLLIFILLAHLLCAFPAGHAIIPLGLFEFILVVGTFASDNEFQTMWLTSSILLLTGQLLMVTALFKSGPRLRQLALVGILTLTMAIISIYYTVQEQAWPITLLSAAPFIILSLVFVKRVVNQSMRRESKAD